MAGKRKGSVRESVEELQKLAGRHRSVSEQERIRMLLLLKKDPAATNTQVGEAIGCTERTVQRWWKIYLEGGIAGLLSDSTASEPVPARPSSSPEKASILSASVCEFLNGLPQNSDTVEWIEAFRSGFRKLFPDIDWMTININIDAKGGGEEANATSFVTQHIGSGANVPRHLKTTIDRSSDSPGNELVKRARSQGFPVDKYHPPSVFDYYSGTGVYLGSMILWRERRWQPISSKSVRSIEKLRSFLVFMFTDCIARRRQADPGGTVFTETVDRIIEEEKLTLRQRDVLLNQLLGKTYEQTAASLSIATNTVRAHVKAIYARTGASSVLELFARHFSPLKRKG